MAKQIKASDKEISRVVDSPSINVQNEFDSLQAHLKELSREFSNKNFRITSLTTESKMLAGDDNQIAMQFEICITAQRQDQKRKIGLI